MAGQINLGTPFGDWLRRLAADPAYKTFLDVGAWNGCGSTLCLAAGVAERHDGAEIWSVEGDRHRAEEAQRLIIDWWALHNSEKPVLPSHPYKVVSDILKKNRGGKRTCPVRLFYGRIAEDMMTVPDICTHPRFPEVEVHFRLHYQNELACLREAPLLPFKKHFDVVVLDGGEFSGRWDWKAAANFTPTVVCLDDTRTMKNCDTLEQLLREGWELLAAGADRNGWAILKRPALGESAPLEK